MRDIVNTKQFGIGIFALAIGLLIYAFGRNVFPFFGFKTTDFLRLSLNGTDWIFGFLPSFIHPVAFCLLCAAIVNKGHNSCVFICFFWGTINSIFEIGQATPFHSWFLQILEYSNFDSIIANNIKFHFHSGVFDTLDLIAVFLGSITSYYLIHLTNYKVPS